MFKNLNINHVSGKTSSSLEIMSPSSAMSQSRTDESKQKKSCTKIALMMVTYCSHDQIFV
jgi:hypothetical protein